MENCAYLRKNPGYAPGHTCKCTRIVAGMASEKVIRYSKSMKGKWLYWKVEHCYSHVYFWAFLSLKIKIFQFQVTVLLLTTCS